MAQPVAEAGHDGKRGGGYKVIVFLFALSSLLGLIAFWQFTRSDRFLSASLKEMASKAGGLSPEGCVDWVVGWSHRCKAMKTLCEASVPRLMDVCLVGADRQAYCQGLGKRYLDTRFGVPECKRRVQAGERNTKKVCAISYRAIASHCERLRVQRQGGRPADRGGSR